MQLTQTWCENNCLLLAHEKCKVIVIHETPHQRRQRERVGLPWQIISAFPSCLITKGLRSSTNLGSFSPSCCFCGQMLAPPQSLHLLLWRSLSGCACPISGSQIVTFYARHAGPGTRPS